MRMSSFFQSIKKLSLSILLLPLFSQADVKIENVILSPFCQKGYHTFKSLPSPKAFSYSRESDTGRDLCNWNHGKTLVEAKTSAMKNCTDSVMKSPCYIIAVDDTFVAKKGQFSFIYPVDTTPLSSSQLAKLKDKAKTQIAGNCLPFFEKYLTKTGHKAFGYSLDKDGNFACGDTANNWSLQKTKQEAIKGCNNHKEKLSKTSTPSSPCKLYAVNNTIVATKEDFATLTAPDKKADDADAIELADYDLAKEKRQRLLHMAETFIDNASCQSSLRLYLYPHKQQAFYLAVDRDGKQACGWSYSKENLEDAKKEAKTSCEKTKKKKDMTSSCKPLFINFHVINEEKDFDIKRGTEDYINAIFRGNLIKVKEYVAVDMDVNTISKKDGITPLFLAVAQGDEAFFNLLVKKGADIQHKAKDGSSLLIAASLGKNPNIVRSLLEKGLDINAKGTGGNTPLHSAFMIFNTYLVGIYMQEGADASIKNTKGISTYDLAKKWKIDIDKLKILDAKKPDHDGTFPLFYAAKAGDIKGIKKLLALNADINNADSDGHSPISYAHESVIELLIKLGADINHQNRDGNTPLMDNVYEKDTAKLLLQLGADKNIKNKSGETAYDLVKNDKGINDAFKALLKP